MDDAIKFFNYLGIYFAPAWWLEKNDLLKNNTLLTWAKELRSWEESNVGTLCKTGEIEISGIAKRMRERLGMDDYKKGHFIIENTFKKRTQQTRDIFLENFFPADYPKDQIHQMEYYTCKDITAKEEK